MTAARMLLASLAILTIFTCAACTNVKAVKDYAIESAKFSAFPDMTERFRDTYKREAPYLTAETQTLAVANDKQRRLAYDDLIAIHRSVVVYMQTLARLAGDDSFDLSQDIGALAKGIKAYPELGVDKKQAEALTQLAKVITHWAAAPRQQRALRDMIQQADEPLQTTLQGMITLIHYYETTSENEQKTVLGFYEVEMPFLDSSKERLLKAIAQEHLEAKSLDYKNTRLQLQQAERGLTRIAEGHRKLRENSEQLSNADMRAQLVDLANDIKILRNSLHAFR